jgi:hypothetical protein
MFETTFGHEAATLTYHGLSTHYLNNTNGFFLLLKRFPIYA